MTTVINEGTLPEPLFLDSNAGKIFALFFPAQSPLKGSILYLPPFAEEMNRCRTTAAHQARNFSRLGYATLLLDPYGTGDSQGDFNETSWTVWLDDVKNAADWLRTRTNTDITLWGCRLGALLAANMADQHPNEFQKLLLWQPVLDGKMFLTQYLRLRVAFLMDNGLPPETTESMRNAMRAGESVEVAGYALSPQLASDLDEKRLIEFSNLKNLNVKWFEHVAESGKPITLISKKVIATLQNKKCDVSVHTFIGPQIWQLQKRDEIPNLVDQTTAVFGNEP